MDLLQWTAINIAIEDKIRSYCHYVTMAANLANNYLGPRIINF